ncbi:MAG: STAS domain-containing protein [Thermoanaerobacterales bacterium]|nr:anti-sigma factor antagonist [Thermoanaerobacterales bacterium]
MTSDQPGSFTVDVVRDGDRATITLGGELDMFASGVLNERLSELGDAREIALDAGAVTFIDSAGLRALLVAREAARDRGVDLRVTSVSQEVTWVAEVAGVTDLLVDGTAGA